MERDVALARLRPLEQRLRRRGVSALYLFGSVARDGASDVSDIDLAFETAPDSRFNLFDQAQIQSELAEELRTKVDFVRRRALRPHVMAEAEAEMVQVF